MDDYIITVKNEWYFVIADRVKKSHQTKLYNYKNKSERNIFKNSEIAQWVEMLCTDPRGWQETNQTFVLLNLHILHGGCVPAHTQ